eukprot:6223506-Pyramimonas_sp.AAC.1
MGYHEGLNQNGDGGGARRAKRTGEGRGREKGLCIQAHTRAHSSMYASSCVHMYECACACAHARTLYATNVDTNQHHACITA